jgi:hypothetical protein
MPTLVKFLDRLLHEGRAVFRQPPTFTEDAANDALLLLKQAYQDYTLEIAGSAPPINGKVALAAAECVRQACWFLVNRDEPAEEIAKRVVMPGRPKTAADHFSADLTLRYIPLIYQRAKAISADDPLPSRIADILRNWPLSGVLAALPEGPAATVNLDGHPGLMMLYAERLARNEKPAWMPIGHAAEYVEVVYHHLQRDVSKLRPKKILGLKERGQDL